MNNSNVITFQFREREAIRLCLKHFRQQNYSEAFEILQKKTKIQLEHRQLTELFDTLVKNGDYEQTESLVKNAIDSNCFDTWISSQVPTPLWTMLLAPQESGSDRPFADLTMSFSQSSPMNVIVAREQREVGGAAPISTPPGDDRPPSQMEDVAGVRYYGL